MFKQIEDSKLADFRLHPEWFPGSKQYHYYQVYDPLTEMEENITGTILIFSIDPIAPSRLFFQVVSFPLQKLQDGSFNPLDDALARIHLDRNGMQELTSLLQTHLDHIV